MSRKQSQIERANWLKQGCCPIHGLFMNQIDSWYYPENSEPYTIVGCSRRDCDAKAIAYSFDGPWKLLPECAYLITEINILPKLSVQNQLKVVRSSRIKQSDIWAKTDGKCYYCGLMLKLKEPFCVDHIIPRSAGGGHHLDNVVPACRSCNSAKGTKTLEDFRFHRRMQKFHRKNGVAFTPAQVQYLESIGVELDIPDHVFWFEEKQSFSELSITIGGAD